MPTRMQRGSGRRGQRTVGKRSQGHPARVVTGRSAKYPIAQGGHAAGSRKGP